eukprot:11179779-Lingulodinium_polyedra.AAC.1
MARSEHGQVKSHAARPWQGAAAAKALLCLAQWYWALASMLPQLRFVGYNPLSLAGPERAEE